MISPRWVRSSVVDGSCQSIAGSISRLLAFVLKILYDLGMRGGVSSKIVALFVLGVSVVSLTLGHAQQRENGVIAKVVLHDDGGRTEWIDDKNNNTTESKRYDGSGNLVSRQIFKLDRMGRAVSMDLYNSRNSIVARTRYAYDDFGRASEQRTYNRRGVLIHQMVYGYDENGRPLAPQERKMTDHLDHREPTAPVAPLLTPNGRIRQRVEAE